MKKLISLLLVVLLLSGLLSVQAFADGESFAGVYTLIDADGDEEDMAEQLAAMAQFGMVATMTLREDGSAELDLFGETDTLQFDFDEMLAHTDGESIPFTLEDGVLTLGIEGNRMIFSLDGPAPVEKHNGAFDYYVLVSLIDEDGVDQSEALEVLAALGSYVTLTIFEDGEAVMDMLGETADLVFDFEQMTFGDGEEVVPFTLEDGILTMQDGASTLRFELSDPGFVGPYVMTAMVTEDDGDMSGELQALDGLGLLPTLVIDENNVGTMDLFGTELVLTFDLETMTATDGSEGTVIPFTYEYGKLHLEEGGNALSFARVLPEAEEAPAE